MPDAIRPDGRIEASVEGHGSPGSAPEWDHEALLYDDDDALSASVAEFLFDGFRLGDPLVVLCTRARRDSLIKRFAASGLDWNEARRSRQIQWMDARTALESIMIGRVPDRARFRSYIGGMIRAGLSGGALPPGDRAGGALPPEDPAGGAGIAPRVRAYGELVDLLWQDGDDQGALLLEDLWNDLGRSYSLSLLCAYCRGNLYRESGLRSWSEVCQRHASVRQVGPDGPMPLDEPLPDSA